MTIIINSVRCSLCGVCLVFLGLCADQAWAGGPQHVAAPYAAGVGAPDEGRLHDRSGAEAADPAIMQAGADHVAAQQCLDGGFGYPHDDCSQTYHNITAPIALGVMAAYGITADSNHLDVSVLAGDFQLTSQYPNGELRLSTDSPYFLAELALLTGDTAYSDLVSQFFTELNNGTYGPNDRDTAGWIAEIQAARQGTWINLLPWEYDLLPGPAATFGYPGQDQLFEDAILSGLSTMDSTDPDNVYSDILGLTGGVRGLALRGRLSFPAIVAPLHADINGISSLEELAALLAGYQNSDGSWFWHSNLAAPSDGDKDTQTTAYAVLALQEVNTLVSASYQQSILDAQVWLEARQLPSGCFESYQGGGEASAYTEVEGEALQALAVTPVPVELQSFTIE